MLLLVDADDDDDDDGGELRSGMVVYISSIVSPKVFSVWPIVREVPFITAELKQDRALQTQSSTAISLISRDDLSLASN